MEQKECWEEGRSLRSLKPDVEEEATWKFIVELNEPRGSTWIHRNGFIYLVDLARNKLKLSAEH